MKSKISFGKSRVLFSAILVATALAGTVATGTIHIAGRGSKYKAGMSADQAADLTRSQKDVAYGGCTDNSPSRLCNSSSPRDGGTRFSDPPSDPEILASGILPQPLGPVGASAGVNENRELARALLEYQKSLSSGAPADAVAPLTGFLKTHPQSRWRAALYMNLGIIYRVTGHMSKALDAWQEAWDLCKRSHEPMARAVADYTVGQLAEFEAYLGRMELLRPLLAEVDGRPMHGSGAANISNASWALAEMRTHPEQSFRCGPMALYRVCLLTGHSENLSLLESAPSIARGTSLSQVADWSRQVGLNYQMAYREPGAPLIVPAVMHWKVGHFAAIVKESDGRYQIEDSTFGENLRVSAATLDSEASGFFAVPPGPLPKGWRTVAASEGDRIWGRGITNGPNPVATGPYDGGAFGGNSPPIPAPQGWRPVAGSGPFVGNGGPYVGNGIPAPQGTVAGSGPFVGNGGPYVGNGIPAPQGIVAGSGPFVGNGGPYVGNGIPGGGYSGNGGMTTPDVRPASVSLALQDIPLSYKTSLGPQMQFGLYYAHRDALQPAMFTYTNFGPKWTSNWISYFTDNSSTTGTYDLYMPGGGGLSYTASNPGLIDQAMVTPITSGGKTVGFMRALPDGSMQTFMQKFGSNQFFLSMISDPQGNPVKLTYDSNMRITKITDAAGLGMTLTYASPGDIYKVTKVTDPFGRFATFTYNSDGQLASITDTLGITSSFSYVFDSGDFISSLATPYGTTTFTYGDSTTDYYLATARFVTITDPLGQTERVEFRQEAPGIPYSDPPNTVPTGMNTTNTLGVWRNVFVWDKHQLAMASLGGGSYDYTKAVLLHYLHDASNGSATSRVLESLKRPLENRIWFNYPNQGNSYTAGSSNLPTFIGRVLDDGTTQLFSFQYNSFGHLTQFTDPIGRQITTTYAANGIDPLSTANTTGGKNQVLTSATYNSQHEPLTVTDAAGQVTNYTYNKAGQVLTVTDPLNETTTYSYSPTGLLLKVTRPFAGAVTSYAYDALNRLMSTTDSQGYKLVFSYDTADRVTKITYPDGTTTLNVYKLLDLESTTDRLKRVTKYVYDALRRLTQRTDPAGRVTKFAYCDCGALSTLTDPKGNATNFSYDLQDRVTAKIFADGHQTSYTYENTTSRLKSITDALGQVTTFTYNADNTLATIAYARAKNPTAPVSLTWDPAFRRFLTITDGTGKTTFAYNAVTSPPALGAAQLASVTGPTGDSVSYKYDALGRPMTTALDGAAAQVGFDSIGRVITDNNPLGTFTIKYLGATQFPTSVTSASGPSINLTYFGNLGDERLQTATNNTHGGMLLSKFQYTYDAMGDVTSTTIQGQFPGTVRRAMTYDAAGQLLGLTATGGGSNYAFGYDLASNRTSEKIGSTTTTFTYNKVNALIAPGASYDFEGEPLTLGGAAFKWDAAHELVSVTAGTKVTKFAYDGFGRRTRFTRLTGGKVTSDKFYFWCGAAPCLETDAATKTITKRYLPQGVETKAQTLYYLRDLLDSVRELVDSSGVVEASYDYDPFGVRSQISGPAQSDFGFGELFHESQSGLDLAFYRAYMASLGRWMNRDPIGEAGGINLYSYAGNNPSTLIDPSGLVVSHDGATAKLPRGGGPLASLLSVVEGASEPRRGS